MKILTHTTFFSHSALYERMAIQTIMKDKRKPASMLNDVDISKKGYVTIIMYTKARSTRTVTISPGFTLSQCNWLTGCTGSRSLT